MKHVIRTVMVLLALPLVASAQFQFSSGFPADTPSANSHGIAVDGEGKLWNGPYYSILINDDAERINPLYIYNEDGTQTDFSPLSGSEVADSLLRFGPITGVSSSPDGSAVYVSSHGFRMTAEGGTIGGVWNQRRSFIHKFDASSGESLGVIEVTYERIETASHAPNRPAVTEDGYVAVSFVFPASPIIILDSNDDYNLLTTVTDDKLGYSRTVEISADGTMIFNPNTEPVVEGGAPGHIEVWFSEGGVFDVYETITPLAVGTDPGAIARYPNSDILFASGGGSGNGPLAGTLTMFNRIYGYSLNSSQVVTHFDWQYETESDPIEIPRAIAFTADGLTAYVGSFSQTGNGAIQKFTAAEPVSVDRPADIASGFQLSQNYPNPFNPTTNISYTMPEAGFATLRVFDTLGRVVATLVNQEMPAGQHTVSFNAANLSSGVYLYELSVGNVRLTNTMTLLK